VLRIELKDDLVITQKRQENRWPATGKERTSVEEMDGVKGKDTNRGCDVVLKKHTSYNSL